MSLIMDEPTLLILCEINKNQYIRAQNLIIFIMTEEDNFSFPRGTNMHSLVDSLVEERYISFYRGIYELTDKGKGELILISKGSSFKKIVNIMKRNGYFFTSEDAENNPHKESDNPLFAQNDNHIYTGKELKDKLKKD